MAYQVDGNFYGVTIIGKNVRIAFPVHGRDLSKYEALELAAWIVALAEMIPADEGLNFNDVLEAVKNT